MSTTNNFKLIENAHTVIKILEIMLQSTTESQEECTILNDLRIDINLVKREKEYLIQIINSDLCKDEHFDIVLKIKNQFNDKIIFKTENELCFDNKIYTENQVNLQSNDEMKLVTEILPYLGKFFYIELKPKLNSEYLEEFQELVINKIYALKKFHTNVKFTFLRDSTILHDDGVEFKKDEEICDFVSFSLINIVKQSQREEYRKKVFNLFNVNNFEELSYSIKRHLISQIHGNTDKITNK